MMTTTGIDVSDMRGHPLPEVEKAAVQPAAGQGGERRTLLDRALAALAAQRRPPLMLLCLQGLARRRGDYDAGLARYTAAIDDDPPRERERARREADLPAEPQLRAEASMTLRSTLGAEPRAPTHLRTSAARHALLRLEVSRLASLEARPARGCSATLSRPCSTPPAA